MPVAAPIEKEANKNEVIVTIYNNADPTKIYEIMESDFDRSQNITDCDPIIAGFIKSGGIVPPNAPWWFYEAMDYLTDLYGAPKIIKKAFEIAESIKSFMIDIGGKERRISHKEMMAIVNAMFVIHEYELIPFDGKKETYSNALKTIKYRVYKSR